MKTGYNSHEYCNRIEYPFRFDKETSDTKNAECVLFGMTNIEEG